MKFEFATAGRILFGAGMVRQAPGAAKSMGKRALVITGQNASRAVPLLDSLDKAGVGGSIFSVAQEPTVSLVREGVEAARQEGCDLVISIGGGSAIDAGKAMAAMLTNEGDPLDYIEVIGKGRAFEKPAAPFIAIPTTAGTGSEVTRNAVLGSPEHGVKASLRSVHLLPALAVVDPELTLGLPPHVTASTGLDALTQLIEPYVSVRANAMTDMFCLEGIRRAGRSLARAWHNGENLEARTDMSWASLLGGLSLANAGLGAVHGFAAPIGGMFAAPHGAVCAAILPHAMEANIRALRARAADSVALARYGEIARVLTGDPQAEAEDGVDWVASLCRELQVPTLREHGLDGSYIPTVVEKAAKASSMKGNPIALTHDEMAELLARAV